MRLGRGYLTIALHELGGDVLIDTKIEIHERDQDDVLERLLYEIDDFFRRMPINSIVLLASRLLFQAL